MGGMQLSRSIRRPAFAVGVALVLGATGFVTSCGGGSSGNAGSKPAAFQLKILDLAPLTGDLAPLGTSGKKSVDLGVAQIEKAIKDLGASETVTVVHADDRGDPKAAVDAARSEIAKGGTGCMIGSWAPDVTLRVATEVAIPAHVLQITPASTSDEIGKLQDAGLVSRTVMPDDEQGRALADVLEQDLGGSSGRRVNLGVESNAYGTGLADSFTRAWKAKQGLIGKRVGFGPKEKSYRPAASALVSGDPDAWALFTFAPPYPALSRALLDTGHWSADKTYVTDALAQPDLPKLAGAEATEGLRGTAPGSPDDNPATAAFDRLYSSSPGPKPQTFDAQAFDAAILCYLSAVGAGKTDGPSMAKVERGISGPPGRVYTWQQLPRAVAALAGGEDIDYEGASGPIDLNGAGDATAGAYDLYRYQDGRITVYDQVIVPKSAP